MAQAALAHEAPELPPNTLVAGLGLVKHFVFKEGLLAKPRVVHAVDGVTIAIRRGETYGLVGESGSGKSTLARLLLRLIDPTRGRIIYDGEDITHAPPRKLRELRRRMQIVFQDPYGSLHPKKKILDIIGEPLRIHEQPPREHVEDKVARMLEAVGLKPEHMHRYPHEFSGGQRQRINIARALILEPEFLVLDEPTSALDVSVQAKILNLLKDLKQKYNLTYLLISHNIAVIDYMSDRIGVMYLGKLVEQAPRDQLIKQPLHPYTRALLTSIPIPDPHKARNRRKLLLKGDPPSPTNPPPGCRFHTRCPYATPKCKTPPPTETTSQDHTIECHHWREILEKDPPQPQWITG